MIFFFIKAILAFVVAVYVLFFAGLVIAGFFAFIGECISALGDQAQRALVWLQSAWSSLQDPWTYPE